MFINCILAFYVRITAKFNISIYNKSIYFFRDFFMKKILILLALALAVLSFKEKTKYLDTPLENPE